MSLSFYKTIVSSVFVFLFSYLLTVNSSIAASSSGFSAVNTTISGVGNTINLLNTTVVSRLVVLLGGVALVVFMWGLILFIHHRNKGADGKDLEKDKMAMFWGLVALFVMTAIWGIIIFARDAIGISSDNNILLPKICTGSNGCGTLATVATTTGTVSQAKTPTQTLGGTCASGEIYAIAGNRKGECVAKGTACTTVNGSGKYDDDLGDCVIYTPSCTSPQILAKDGDYANSCVTSGAKCDDYGGIYDGDGDCVSGAVIAEAKYYPELSKSSNYVQRDSDCVADNTTKCDVDGVGLVTYVQTVLQQTNCSTDKPDGIFGDRTYNALKKFQKANKLYGDGIVGDTTWQILMYGRQSGYLSTCK